MDIYYKICDKKINKNFSKFNNNKKKICKNRNRKGF